jgi:hypothetical protein
VTRRAAALHGAAAFAAVLLLGELLAVLRAAGPLDPSALAVFRAGALAPSFVHGVPVEIELTDPVFGDAALTSGFEFGFTLRVALVLATVMAGWLLFRGGRRAAQEVGGSVRRRAVEGALVAVPYVVLSVGATLVARGSDPAILLGRGFAGLGQSEAAPSVGWSVALSLVLATACGGAGGLSTVGQPAGARMLRAALAGGWRMAWLALTGGTAGILVVVALHPEATRSYLHAAAARGPAGAAVVVLGTLLALPNAGAGAVAAAVGAPIVLRASGSACTVVSYARLGAGCDALGIGPLSPAYALFVAVPLAAALAGGWWAARRAGGTTLRAAAAGGLAGVPFAVLLAALAFLATPSWEAGGSVLEVLGSGGLTLGPPVGTTLLAALAWGVTVGAVGGLLQARRVERGTERARG